MHHFVKFKYRINDYDAQFTISLGEIGIGLNINNLKKYSLRTIRIDNGSKDEGTRRYRGRNFSKSYTWPNSIPLFNSSILLDEKNEVFMISNEAKWGFRLMVRLTEEARESVSGVPVYTSHAGISARLYASQKAWRGARCYKLQQY